MFRYLLERTGDIHGAMTNLLRTLETALSVLKTVFHNSTQLEKALASSSPREGHHHGKNHGNHHGNHHHPTPRTFRSRSSGSVVRVAADTDLQHLSVSVREHSAHSAHSAGNNVPVLIRQLEEFQHCNVVLHDLVGLCDRHSHFTPMHSGRVEDGSHGGSGGNGGSNGGRESKQETNNEKLWFTVLDFVLQQKHGVRGEHAKGEHGEEGKGFDVSNESIQLVLADFVHVILTHMNGRVSLKSILKKITHDHKNQEFREFRKWPPFVLNGEKKEFLFFGVDHFCGFV